MRRSMRSTTSTATARPKRERNAAGIGSWFSIVPVAVASVSTPDEGLDSVSVRVSLPSLCASSFTVTSMVVDDWPVRMYAVPSAAM